ncbi:hypothetical protein D3C81_2295480 [compost metagenome]
MVLLGIELRELVQKGDDPPDVLVFHAFAPCWHAGGLDTMFNYPERSCGAAAYAALAEVGRCWV